MLKTQNSSLSGAFAAKHPDQPLPTHCGLTTYLKRIIQQTHSKGSLKMTTPEQNVTLLPDGSAFSTASYPLPKDHWLYAPRVYDGVSVKPRELPTPILTHEQKAAVVAAIRYAIRGATCCGKDMDFDPDALVQNAVYALCGPFSAAVNKQGEDNQGEDNQGEDNA